MTIKQHFRITSIQLDQDEDVASVCARATDATCDVIAGMLPGDPGWLGEPAPDGYRKVTLQRPAMGRMHFLTGKIRGTDPRHEVTGEIYDSLCMVIYGLIED